MPLLTQRLRDPLLRRAVLRGVAEGHTIEAICDQQGISRTSIHRYGRFYPRFRDRVKAAREMRGSTESQLSLFLDGEPIDEPGALERQKPPATPPALKASEVHRNRLLEKVIGSQPHQLHPQVIDCEVIEAPEGEAQEGKHPPAGPGIPVRSADAFYDKVWRDFHNPNLSDVRVVASMRTLDRHYDTERKRSALIEIEMARQGAASGDRQRGLTPEAKQRALYDIIGPPVEDDEPDEDEGVA